MAEHTDSPQPVSPWVLGVAAFAAAVVVIVAATVSYAHMYHLADRAGEGGLARLIPASVDGLVFFASTLIYAQHTSGEPKSKLAVFAVVLGVLMSIVANVVSKVPGLVSPTAVQVVVAAWPPAALGMVGHLAWKLLTLALRARQDVPRDVPRDGARTLNYTQIGKVQFGPENVPAHLPGSNGSTSQEHHPELPAGTPEILPGNTRRPSRKKAREASQAVTDDALMVFVRKLRDDLGDRLTGYAIRKALQDDGHRIGNDRAGRLAERALAEQRSS